MDKYIVEGPYADDDPLETTDLELEDDHLSEDDDPPLWVDEYGYTIEDDPWDESIWPDESPGQRRRRRWLLTEMERDLEQANRESRGLTRDQSRAYDKNRWPWGLPGAYPFLYAHIPRKPPSYIAPDKTLPPPFINEK